MARCRKEHNFGPWKPYRYCIKYGYREMTEKEVKEKQKEYDEELERRKREKTLWYRFLKILWERRCKKCNKKELSHLDPYDTPKNIEPKEKVKERTRKSKLKREKEERHGRKLRGKESSTSKGWKRPW